MNGKKILSLLLSVVCAFGAAACREQEEPPQKTPYELYAEVPVVYEKQTAAYEDSALSLWFDHAFSKTVRQDVTPTGRDTYKIYMGKNEKENCQFFLSGAEDKTFSVSATDFRSETGDTVPVSLYYQYYFEMDYEGERQDVPDAIPPVKEGAVFTVRAEESAGFVLQAKTSPDTPSGDYTAELTVLNEAGQEVKTATVFLHVWDFTLSEDTVCRTAMWVDKNRLGGHDYQTLYDYLLENRVNAYDLPYALSDPAVDEYLDNPRVNSFNILGFKFNRESGKSEGQIRDAMTYAYEKLSPVAAWNTGSGWRNASPVTASFRRFFPASGSARARRTGSSICAPISESGFPRRSPIPRWRSTARSGERRCFIRETSGGSPPNSATIPTA